MTNGMMRFCFMKPTSIEELRVILEQAESLNKSWASDQLAHAAYWAKSAAETLETVEGEAHCRKRLLELVSELRTHRKTLEPQRKD
jgi:hypothetical protein